MLQDLTLFSIELCVENMRNGDKLPFYVFSISFCRNWGKKTYQYCIMGNIGGAKLWCNVKSFKMAQSGSAIILDNCCRNPYYISCVYLAQLTPKLNLCKNYRLYSIHLV